MGETINFKEMTVSEYSDYVAVVSGYMNDWVEEVMDDMETDDEPIRSKYLSVLRNEYEDTNIYSERDVMWTLYEIDNTGNDLKQTLECIKIVGTTTYIDSKLEEAVSEDELEKFSPEKFIDEFMKEIELIYERESYDDLANTFKDSEIFPKGTWQYIEDYADLLCGLGGDKLKKEFIDWLRDNYENYISTDTQSALFRFFCVDAKHFARILLIDFYRHSCDDLVRDAIITDITV